MPALELSYLASSRRLWEERANAGGEREKKKKEKERGLIPDSVSGVHGVPGA